MNDKRGIEVYPGQFQQWEEGVFVASNSFDNTTLDELRAAISANFAIMEMVNSCNWDINA